MSDGEQAIGETAAAAAAGARCFGDADPLYARYHDEEWGYPVRDEHGVFERICLEAFQSGLAWITILRKREAIRSAFAGFDPERVARYGDDDVARLLADAAIIRNRAKIEATIANARAVLALRERGGDLGALLWSFAPRRPPPAARTFAELPAATQESTALSKALKAAGLRFVGPTTAYATMQACGVVNDHLAGCPIRARVSAERSRRR